MEANSIEKVKRSKSLEVGSTLIAQRTGNYNGELKIFSIYYGNYVEPPVRGEFIHLKPKRYYEVLNKFLHSEEGKEYTYPSKDEIEEATRLVICRESQIVLEEKPVKKESNNPQEIIKDEKEPSSNDQDFSNLKGNLKILVGIVIIQFVCIIGLIAILVIRK